MFVSFETSTTRPDPFNIGFVDPIFNIMDLPGLNTGRRKINLVKPGESAGNKGGKSARETTRMKSEIHIDLSPCNIQFKQMS